jgi:signal transduction histidine kinase
MTRRVVLAYLLIDLVFEAEIALGFSYVLGVETTAERLKFFGGVAIVAASLVTPFLISLALLLRPVERWIAADTAGHATTAQLERAGRTLRMLPKYFTLLQMIKWPIEYATVGLIHGAPSQAALWLFVLAFVFGPPPIGHSMAVSLTAPAMSRYSLAAHAAGLPDPAPATTLRFKLAWYSVCLCMAPAFYMSSVAIVVQQDVVTGTGLAMLVGCFLTAVCVFAGVCAGLLANTITTPIRAIAEVIQGIASTGFASATVRIATLRRDEVGGLAELTNSMIEALARTEQARRDAATALADLNHTLELRVAERTSSLVDANAALAAEMRARATMELELRQAQKLESVGRLAAGIAHEINTPLQFVGDSVQYARECVGDLGGLLAGYRDLRRAVLDGEPARDLATGLGEREQAIDLPYVLEQLSPALDLALHGVQRVGGIVRSVKQFAYPDRVDMAPADLNLAIQSTITVAAGEYKDVAEISLELGELPHVVCHIGEINQVVLNLIVNAAHAIGDAVRGTTGRGRITIRTRRDGDAVIVAIADTGTGIPEHVRPHIFDAFFTTKEVGRGTGQGLAIARSVVVDKHGGRLTFESAEGTGSEFFIRLPVTGRPAASAPAPAPAPAPASPAAA